MLVDLESRQVSSAIIAPKPATPVQAPTPAPVVAAISKPPTPTPTATAPAPIPAQAATPISRPVSIYQSNHATPTTPSSAARSLNHVANGEQEAELTKLKEQISGLKDAVAERDTTIRYLELKLEKIKSAMS